MAIETYFENIAAAIKQRAGTSGSLTPAQMPQAILDIPGGTTPTLITKSITQNGTYDASADNADGYSSVTVNVPSGGGAVKIANWDLAVSNTDTINSFNVSVTNVEKIEGVGYQFDGDRDYIYLPKNLKNNDSTYVLDIGTMSLYDGTVHNRLFMSPGNTGLIYRNNGTWSFYNGSAWATDSNITAFDYFANSKIGIYVDIKNQWHVYKNGVLVYTPNKTYYLQDNTDSLSIGSYNGQSARNFVIKGIEVYRGNPYS